MKAHIAANQHTGTPTVLCWNLTRGDIGKLDGMATAFGMRVAAVTPEETGKTVAQLLDSSCAALRVAAPDMAAYPATMLFADFRERDLDTLLDLMKQAQVQVVLKAAATETNRGWTWAALLAHLSAEHAAFAAQQKV